MNVMIFDTETTDLNKCFCYNIGYVILDTETGAWVEEKEYIVEQIWHNLPLFSTAYYSDKRPLYIEGMRSHRIKMDKWGYIMGAIKRDIKKYDIKYAYAYNSNFDDKVITFNCEWFHTNNPFENIPIIDIMGNTHTFLVNDYYKEWCEMHNLFTESGNYSTTAENVFRYLTNNIEFNESHTALDDSKIESVILIYSFHRGAEVGTHYPKEKAIPRNIPKHSDIYINGEKVMGVDYTKVWKKSDMSVIKFS